MKPDVSSKTAVLPRQRVGRRIAADLLGVGLFVSLMSLGAHVRIPLWPVPVTLQTLFVPLAGLMLGARLGAVSMGAYLALGLCGAPVFSMGGGPAYVASPTFGYMLAFPAAAWLAGRIGRTKRLAVWRIALANVAAHAVIFAVGVPWLAGWFAVTDKAAWTAAAGQGFLPFLPGMAYKIAAGTAAAAAGWLPARRLWPTMPNTREESTGRTTES